MRVMLKRIKEKKKKKVDLQKQFYFSDSALSEKLNSSEMFCFWLALHELSFIKKSPDLYTKQV